MLTKTECRQKVRAARGSRAQRALESEAICRSILGFDAYRRAATVAAYAALPWEADVSAVAQDALSAGKTLCMPRVGADGAMTFHRVYAMEDLVPGRWGIPEPSPDAATVAPEEIDLMLIPLEAVDAEGMRLGKGGGYYDRVLPCTDAVRLGVALTWQWVDRVPSDPWDAPLDAAAHGHGVTVFMPRRPDHR